MIKQKNRKIFLILMGISILILCVIIISAARLPTVGGDTDAWGTILNTFLNVSHNESGELRNDTVSTLQIADGTITDADISDTINLTLGEKITFTLGGLIDNIVNDWVRITGGLNVTGGNLTVDTDTLFVDADNNRVGIGTESPGALAPTGYAIGPLLELKSPTIETDVGLLLRRSDDVVGLDLWVDGSNPWDTHFDNRYETSDFIFTGGTRTVGGTDELMRIKYDGKVGIGTASPTEILQIEGATVAGGDNYIYI